MQGCWRRAVALGRVVPARRAIAASSAREGEKARNGPGWIVVSVKSLEKLVLDVFLVVDHDFDLKIGALQAVFEKMRLIIFHWTEVVESLCSVYSRITL